MEEKNKTKQKRAEFGGRVEKRVGGEIFSVKNIFKGTSHLE
jgi:hypothetical protein